MPHAIEAVASAHSTPAWSTRRPATNAPIDDPTTFATMCQEYASVAVPAGASAASSE